MTVRNIVDLNLHDSGWISTFVRTTDEGDENIILELDYLADYTESKTIRKSLTFVRCWGAKFQLNFRYFGPDSIFSAEEKTNSDLITEIKGKWKDILSGPANPLRHFIVIAGTTGSRIDVVAEELRLSDSN